MRAEGGLREAGVKNSTALIYARYYLSWTCGLLNSEMLDHLLGLMAVEEVVGSYHVIQGSTVYKGVFGLACVGGASRGIKGVILLPSRVG
jgi:hypothetical protein